MSESYVCVCPNQTGLTLARTPDSSNSYLGECLNNGIRTVGLVGTICL